MKEPDIVTAPPASVPGKSDIRTNVRNALAAGFDRIILVATSPSATGACQRTCRELKDDDASKVELMTWLDVA